mmetsp:Transcript_4910/g.10839  ORF Transcript_4910/g.10839 Transcript_4910/m.10839 type:complete len:377 (-) Transcript_4910:189-1319(-)
MMRSAKAAVSVALILSTTSVESFRSASFTSRVVIHHPSRSLHADIPITSTTPRPSITSPPLSTSSSTSNTRLYNLVDPEDFPTIEIANPPQEDIYKQAIQRTILWVGLAVAFGSALGIIVDPATSEEFFAGYLVEQSLSVDNLFVFLLLFEYFKVPLSSQDRVLNWGIYGAIVMRALMIGLGAAALEKFHAILLVFAAILVYSSAKTLIPEDEDEEEEDLNDNAIVKFSRNLIDSVDEFDGSNFFTMVDGVKKATPLFICMVSLEISDVVFAVDSIPAVFGVTSNPLVVFSSNMFAIMGLRSLYTILSKAATDLKYLEPAVGIVLGFIGSKMIAEYFGAEIPTEVALGVVAFFLTGGVALSVAEKGPEEDGEIDID